MLRRFVFWIDTTFGSPLFLLLMLASVFVVFFW